MTHFTTWCWQDKNVMYSDNCHYSEHLFGCISMKRKKYCILNKQYTKEEYEALVPKIIERMMADKEWGEFFPMPMTPFCYNETAATEYFPLEKDKVLALGLRWHDEDSKNYKPQTVTLPDSIKDVKDDIADALLACEHCKKNFKILKQELTFYRDMNLPAPAKCYECRYTERVRRRNPRHLWERPCAKCTKQMWTSYPPERPEIVYCEECYLKEVY